MKKNKMRNSSKCSQQNAKQVQIFTNHAKQFQIFTNHADTQDHSNHSFIKKEKGVKTKDTSGVRTKY